MVRMPKPTWGTTLAAAGAVELAGEPAIDVDHIGPTLSPPPAVGTESLAMGSFLDTAMDQLFGTPGDSDVS